MFSKAEMFKKQAADERQHITSRELDFLHRASNGMTTADVAKQTGMSAHTVNLVLRSVTRKLSAANKTHAVSKALRIGLIS